MELGPSTAYGGNDDGEGARCLAVIARANADLTSFTARVRQTKKLALLEEPLESTGRLIFQRPDRIAWQIEEPTALRVIIDLEDAAALSKKPFGWVQSGFQPHEFLVIVRFRVSPYPVHSPTTMR